MLSTSLIKVDITTETCRCLFKRSTFYSVSPSFPLSFALYLSLSVVIIFLRKHLNALTLTNVVQVQLTAEHTSL